MVRQKILRHAGHGAYGECVVAYSGKCWREGMGLLGWARSSEHDCPLWVELLVDGESMGACLADMDFPQPGGFWLPLPPPALENGARIAARIANSDHIFQCESPPPVGGPECGLVGEMFLDRCLLISGWMLDAAEPDKILRLAAFVEGQKVAETLANGLRYRPDKANGHGFSLQLPPNLPTGKQILVEIRDNAGRTAPGSPLKIIPFPQNVADWLKYHSGLKGAPALHALLENYERRLGGCLRMASINSWLETFPIPKPSGKTILNLAVHMENGQSDRPDLGKQAGVDIRKTGNQRDYCLFIRKEEKLNAHALAHMLAAMRQTGACAAYADSLDKEGAPLFKPAWDREFFLARDYLGPLLVSQQALLGEKDGDYASARARAVLEAEKLGGICHVPLPLSTEAPLENTTARNGFLNNWLAAEFPGSRLEACPEFGHNRVRYGLSQKPRVSLIIPTRDHGDMLAACLTSIYDTDWPDLEILIVDNGSMEEKALDIMDAAEREKNAIILRRPGVFNYAALNNEAVEHAAGALVCFMNNDVAAFSPDWLAEMAAPLLAFGERGGCVGAKLVWPGGLVQHGGVIVGIHELAGHVGNQWLEDEPGYMGINQLARQYSAATAACMLTPKALFQKLGGFDARHFPVAFNDVDYCLRLREAGKMVYWTPYAKLRHLESASRGKDASPSQKSRAEREMACFRKKWACYQDPFYNPNLAASPVMEPFSGLAFPPRARNAR